MQAPKAGAIPTEQQALRHGGWRNLPADPLEEKMLRASYALFMAEMSTHTLGAEDSVKWVCITPERWSPCPSYTDAVSLLKKRGVGVVDQAFRYRHMDLCDLPTYRERRNEAGRSGAAHEVSGGAGTQDNAVVRGAHAAGPLYVMTTTPSSELIAAWEKTTAEDYHRFLAANPSIIWDGF